MRLTGRFLTDRKGLAAAVVAAVALGATAGVTLGGFSATIVNPTNTFSSGTVQLEEGVASTTCFSTGTGSGGSVSASNTGTCSGIDDLGAALDQVPAGTPVSTTVTLTNVGNTPTSTASLVPGSCTAGDAVGNGGYDGADTAGFCNEVDVTIANTTSGAPDGCVYPVEAGSCPSLSNTYTLHTLSSQSFSSPPMSPLAAGASATYEITVALDSGATNADQGLTATIPLTWSITQ